MSRVKKLSIWQRLRRDLLMVKEALAQEKQETKEMLSTYRRYTQKQASAEELRKANKQFADVLKSLGLSMFAVLPFAPITIPLIVKLGKILGVDVLPSSFNATPDELKQQRKHR